ncbi:phospholipase A [Porticoccaceae bacterium LTM1]|nr:phospholipase A [Porticoccaceae bacterium LTM1]
MRKVIGTVCALALLFLTAATQASVKDQMQECLLTALLSATDEVTVGELKEQCRQVVARQSIKENGVQARDMEADEETAVERRINLERYTANNPFVLNAHRPTYFLPFAYNDSPNEVPFEGVGGSLDNVEFQFQVSFKAMMWDGVFGDKGRLDIAYTNRSFWQAYNTDISAPFRETNHEPELILGFQNDWEVFGLKNIANRIIFNHQSNGRSGNLSRSWNRVMAEMIFERDNFAMSFKPWWRVPEDYDASVPDDPSNDNNRDITDYLGHFELAGAYRTSDAHTWSMMIRDPVSGKGAYELSWSFPISYRLRGYLKYFNGYGENLIDYNVKNETIGIGFQLTDWL